ncbi:hypothetical protein CGRAC_0687 [Campylobacter gracilis]|uniref:Uncharacterized protein n=1 Tax=Campylobacter gracilis RM3268 TaxID=553220 RepID=C8PK13_9BACT|nr:hypothetical protein CGRAC_0687 [Campylobacter gracilis]EEV17268.1 hypothetical protein CAMGR0001_1564 [Campylobacter gracilis RM3268]
MLAKFRRFAKGADLRRANHYFAEKAKFTARKFHILREARKFRFLEAIDKFCPLQAALNFKILPPQNGHSYQARLH